MATRYRYVELAHVVLLRPAWVHRRLARVTKPTVFGLENPGWNPQYRDFFHCMLSYPTGKNDHLLAMHLPWATVGTLEEYEEQERAAMKRFKIWREPIY